MTCKEIFDKTEVAYRLENEKIAKLILLEFENKFHIKLTPYKVSMTSYLIYLLSEPRFDCYRNELINLLEKYQVNEKTIILSFIENLNQMNLPDFVRNNLEDSLITLPYCSRLELLRNGYIVESKNGEIIEAYNLYMKSNNNNLINALSIYDFKHMCHQSVELLSKYMNDSFIVTSKMNALFNGYYYHSYFKTKNEGDIIDVASNTLYKNNTFDKFFKPEVLQEIDINLYEKEASKLKECKADEHMCKVLRLALSK